MGRRGRGKKRGGGSLKGGGERGGEGPCMQVCEEQLVCRWCKGLLILREIPEKFRVERRGNR